jgi:hypothetical protein
VDHYHCPCRICQGKPVSRTTEYRHARVMSRCQSSEEYELQQIPISSQLFADVSMSDDDTDSHDINSVGYAPVYDAPGSCDNSSLGSSPMCHRCLAGPL